MKLLCAQKVVVSAAAAAKKDEQFVRPSSQRMNIF